MSQYLAGELTSLEIESVQETPLVIARSKEHDTVLRGSEAQRVLQHLRDQDPTQGHAKEARNQKSVTGHTGNRGAADGRVFVLNAADYDNQSRLKELEAAHGAILVTPMTRPDLVPYMQKAAAYVTDEGGITCHAAIIARELKKPCVIGTKVATQVLHDGDLVEVDARSGVVRIVNGYE